MMIQCLKVKIFEQYPIEEFILKNRNWHQALHSPKFKDAAADAAAAGCGISITGRVERLN